ncbi:MAG: ABC transporter substrate-binding protein, partial [Pseudomonadota bacterium]
MTRPAWGTWRRQLQGIAAGFLALTLAAPLQAQDDTITAHGISTFGPLALPADFTQLPYVNPDAPKGGEISVWAFGGYDSMNPYTLKGRADRLASAPLESLLEGTADEIGAVYGLLAESISYPEDRSSVVFALRPEAKFSDGSPLTAEDVLFTYETFREKGLPSYRTVLAERVADAKVLGPHQIEFSFTPGIPTRDLIQMVGG